MSDATVSSHRFANGLVLVAERMPGVQSAAFSFLIPAGAAFEKEELGGTATMLSEWLMRGAGDRDSRQLLGDLDNLGVSHGESAQTVHTSVSAATLGRNILPALEIYADVLLRPHLDGEEFESIQSLALQSLQSLEDDPGSKVIYELRRRHFPDPWGRPAPGNPEGVKAATPDDLRAFHARHFRPNGAILAVAGAIEWESLKDAVGRLFGDWQSQPEPAVQLRPTGPLRDYILRETQQTQVAVAFPTVTIQSPDYYLARASVGILGGYSSARLFTEVREKRGLCYSVYSSYESQRERAAVVCYAGTSNERAQETLDVTLTEIERLGRDGVEPEELETMKAGLKSSLIMQQESSMSRSGSLASDWYYLGRVRPLGEISSALGALTADGVTDFVKRQPASPMTLLTLGPNPLKFPEA